MSYQERDREVVDYELYRLRPPGWMLRGPEPETLEPGQYFACVGAAQTFGCFCSKPWPTLLSERIGLPVLNLGLAGAGPELFLAPDWLRWIRGARFVVFQVMSARSASNSVLESGGSEYLTWRDDGRRQGADDAWAELLQADLRSLRSWVARRVANRVLAAVGRRRVRELVAETRADWLASFRRLLAEAQVPSVLFWFSKRAPRYRARYRNALTLFGEFPHLVDEHMIDELRPHADAYVECVTSRGSPQPLISRFTGEPVTVDPRDARSDLDGEPWTVNAYYPSPEMHVDAAAALGPTCDRWRAD